ncbi:MAG: NAD(P)H-dependent oxidoreductase [Oscillospiraceae bacterium]|nr:NAD(P)H-dependent oxidoreductase [Oscillospiraceae bacterium]
MTAEKIGSNIEEFFLPRDFNEGCSGCGTCLHNGRENCPHSEKVEIIFNSMLSSDVIIIGSPTYVMEMTAHLKGFFEHIFTAWLGHRPEEVMFSKTAVVISTGAIIGMNNVTKSLARQMFYLGVPKTYRLSFGVMAASWDGVNSKVKKKIITVTDRTARKIITRKGYAAPGIKAKFMFSMLRKFHKNNDLPLFATDKKYWIDKKWLDKTNLGNIQNKHNIYLKI